MQETHTKSASPIYEYSLKIINPKKKSKFVVSKLSSKIKFDDIEDLKKQIQRDFKQKVEDPARVY